MSHQKVSAIVRPDIEDYRKFTIEQIEQAQQKLNSMLLSVKHSKDRSNIIRISNVLTKFNKE